MAKVQLIGGNFQDAEGNVLNSGYLTMELSADAEVPSTTQVGAGAIIRIDLDANGNVKTSPAQSVWPNDQLNPSGTYYVVKAYKANGQLSWGPQYVTVASGVTFDVGTWVPMSGGGSPVTPIAVQFETNGVLNDSQTILNLQQGSGITLSESNGTVTINGASGVLLETNNTPNGSQSTLNLKQGTGITLTDDGVGGVTVSTSAVASVPAYRPWWRVFADQTGSPTLLNIGIGSGFVASGSLSKITVAPFPELTRATSLASVGATGGWFKTQGTGNGSSVGAFKRMIWTMRPVQLVNSRCWLLLQDASSPNIIGNTDTPTGAGTVGFRCSSFAGDTTWKAWSCTGTVGQFTIVDTGITPDITKCHQLELRWDGVGTFTYYIDNVLVATINTNLPSGMFTAQQACIIMQVNNGNVSTPVAIDLLDFYTELST